MKKQKKMILPKYDDPFKELMRNELVRKHFLADFLGIPVEEIARTKLLNTFLWKYPRGGKQGILDVLVELEGRAKLDIEIQLAALKHWDKRAVFYIAKMYTDDLRRGEDYEKAKKCILISLLDFNLSRDREYHHIYRLRDREGKEFTDVLEIHVVELRKVTDGDRPIDEWIRLLNVETKEELEMLGTATKNKGIMEAVRELDLMNLPRNLRLLHEEKLKQKRDWNAMLAYARDEGLEAGRALGLERGMERGKELGIRAMILDGVEDGLPGERIIAKLEKRFELSREKAEEFYEKYGK